MRWIRRFFVTIIVIILVLVGVAYLLPREAEVARSVVIDAPADEIFPHVTAMKASEAWSPWLSHDPDTKLTYEGPEAGVGNKLTWESENPRVGSGSQTITASVENERVETALDFGPMGTADAAFSLVAEGEGTRVTWGFVTDLGMNPLARWMGLMMDRWVGADYEKGLSNLKSLVEGG